MSNKKGSKKGFTLVEMLVAVSIFTLVAFTITTVFVSAFSAYRKAQAMKRIMDNLNFAVDTLIFNLREGSCIKVFGVDAQGFGESISFIDSSGQSLEYRWDSVNNSLKENNQSLNSSDVKINKFKVKKIGSQGRRLVRLIIEGEAGSRETEKTVFKVETSVAQRNSDPNASCSI